MSTTQQTCPQCGADLPSGKECRSLFDQCLALEFEYPTSYGQVHFLTVTCYLLQHNAYSRAAWLEARKMLALYVRQGISPNDLRRRMQQELDNGHRSWSVTKGERFSKIDSKVWSRSIADIRLDNAETYCVDIDVWAKSVLEDTESIIENGG
jgi:hypothetical protein